MMNNQYTNPGFCFILGRGRSGTSLLASMLNANPEVSIAPEALFIMNTADKYANTTWDEGTIHRFVSDVWLERRIYEWSLEQDELVEWLLEHGRGTNFSTVCNLVYEKHAMNTGKKRPLIVGDKNPHYALFSSKLSSLLPNARFIHIVRDYRDNILSYQKAPFDCKSVGALAYRWKAYNKHIEETKIEFPTRFLTVTYESLVHDPTQQLKSICAHLNVPFDKDMLHFYNKNNDQSEWHKNLSSPITPSSINKWEVLMTLKQQMVADAICLPLSATYGYEPANSTKKRLSFYSRFCVFTGWLLLIAEKFLFKMPISLRGRIIRYYRFFTGTHDITGNRTK